MMPAHSPKTVRIKGMLAFNAFRDFSNLFRFTVPKVMKTS